MHRHRIGFMIKTGNVTTLDVSHIPYPVRNGHKAEWETFIERKDHKKVCTTCHV